MSYVGSGKSTLAMSILRFVGSPLFSLYICLDSFLIQVDPTSGRIVIDGIDISKIGIQDLRSRLVSLYSNPIVQSAFYIFYQTFIPQVDSFYWPPSA